MIITGMETVVGLFPGQGVYKPGLREGWTNRSPVIVETFDVVDAVSSTFFGRKVSETIFSGEPLSPAEFVAEAPGLVELAIFGLSVAGFRLLEERGARPSVLVGHSFGEIGALTCADALAVEDAAEIICHRSLALRESPDATGSMLALRCSVDTAERILALIGDPRIVVAAVNGPGQVVVSGPAVRAVSAVVDALGIDRVPLQVRHPFHNPLLDSARMEFIRRIEGFRRKPLRLPVFSPILGRFYRDSDELGPLIGAHLVKPVEFAATVSLFREHGARIFVELGPGSTLSDLVRQCHSDLEGIPLLDGTDDEASVVATAAFLTGRGESAPVGPPSVEPPAPQSVALAEGGRSEVSARVRALYATALEYPGGVLSDDAALEADLGVDSVKRTSLETRAFEFAESDRSQVSARVRALYATALEYPEDVLSDDAALEADLGVDSVKRTSLETRAFEDFGLPMSANPAVGAAVTFGDVVDMVCRALDADSAGVRPRRDGTDDEASVVATAAFLTGRGEPAPAGPPSVEPPAPQSVALAEWDRSEVSARVRALYATALEYPEDVLSDDAALEADLGVDSVKRTSLETRAFEDFGLPMSANPAVGAAVTFGDVVDMVYRALDADSVSVR